ncbi:unnamed protein product [Cylindrotheca closterium]|uniref:Uncharacterized protein n=1 Tax=Cylindrotheca closterium TaxID=2856 RepID=A0AAD2CK02_9STRA|nr:unnamed protein product [Cylindrotheca closterium]
MSTKEGKSDDKQRSRKDRDRQDEDVKAMERARRSGGRRNQSTASGAESEKEVGLSRSSSHRNDRRTRDEREAKDRARNGRSSSSSRPGVSHESRTSDRSRQKSSGKSSRTSGSPRGGRKKNDEKKGYRNRRSSTPGAQAEDVASPRSRSSRRSGSRKGDEKKGYRNTGASTPGVQAERKVRDKASRKVSRHNSNSRNVHMDGTIVSNATAGDDGYAVHASIVGAGSADEGPTKEEQEAQMNKMAEEKAKRLREQEREEERQQREREEQEAEKKRKKRRNLVILLVLLLLIGGGAAAYFGTRGASNGGGDVAVDDGNNQNPADDTTSESPSSDPTMAGTNPPSQFTFKYPPPDLEDCQRLMDREPPLVEEGTLENREFEVDFDLGLSSADTNTTSVFPQVEQKIAEWLLPPLVGCDLQRRLDNGPSSFKGIRGEALRRLQSSEDPLRYMIADVLDIRAVDQAERCSTASDIPNCNFVTLKMNVLLRGDELNLYVATLLSGFFPEGQDLKVTIGFSDDIAIFAARSIRATGPTKAPSVMPSREPSVSPSDFPTKEPTIPIAESMNPSALVPEPTKLPSESPSKTPSATPSSVPTPTPPPTFAPIPGTTPIPTQTASGTPSQVPSKTPSSAPSVAPVIAATPSPTITASSMPSMSPSAAPIHACASLDLRDFNGQKVFGYDQNGAEHFYTFSASGMASWQIWDGTSSVTSMLENSRDPSFLSASYGDTMTGKSGEVTLLTTTNTASYLEINILGSSRFEMKIYLAEPGCLIPASGNVSCGSTLGTITMGSTLFGEDQNGLEHHYTFDSAYGEWKIWDGTGTTSLPESSRSPSGLRGYYEDVMTGKNGQVYLLSTSDASSYLEINTISSSSFEMKIYLSESSCGIPVSGNPCGATLGTITMGREVFREDEGGLEHHYAFDSSYAYWTFWYGTGTTSMPESSRSASGLRAYHSDMMTGKSGEVFLLSTSDATSYLEINVVDSSTFEMKIYISESSCEIPVSGNACGATLSTITVGSAVFREDEDGLEHHYAFDSSYAYWKVWDGMSAASMNENSRSESQLRAYHSDMMTGKSGEVFLLSTTGASSLEINVIDSSRFEMKIYISESTCEIPVSGNSCGATLSTITVGSAVFREDEDGLEHHYTFDSSYAYWKVWDGMSAASMNENSRSESQLRAYHSDMMTGKSGEVFLLSTTGASSLEINVIDSSRFEMKIYISESTCEIPVSGNSCGATLSTITVGSAVFREDEDGLEHHYTFDSSYAYWKVWDGMSAASMNENSRSESQLRAYHSDMMTGKSGEVFLLSTSDATSYLEINAIDGTTFEMKIYISESTCEIPVSGNSCGATLSTITVGSAVFREDEGGLEHHYTFDSSYAYWKVWDGMSTASMIENSRSGSQLRAYYSDMMTGKSGEVFLLSTSGASYLEINVIGSSRFEMKIYISESSCEIPISGIPCGATLSSFGNGPTVTAVDTSAKQHTYAFDETYAQWQISGADNYMSESMRSASGLRAYYSDMMSGKSGEVIMHAGTGSGSVDVTILSPSTYEMNIYVSSSCALP